MESHIIAEQIKQVLEAKLAQRCFTMLQTKTTELLREIRTKVDSNQCLLSLLLQLMVQERSIKCNLSIYSSILQQQEVIHQTVGTQ